MELIEPNSKYKQSFIEAVSEYQATESDDRKDIYELKVNDLEANFPMYITNLISESEGKNLPEGYVPQSTFWLVDDGKFIGRVSIRHTLNEFLLKVGGHIGYDIRPTERGKGYGNRILELALPKAKQLGIDKVLLTCNDSNLASKKIIEANGGVLENTLDMGEGKPKKLRFWITF